MIFDGGVWSKSFSFNEGGEIDVGVVWYDL